MADLPIVSYVRKIKTNSDDLSCQIEDKEFLPPPRLQFKEHIFKGLMSPFYNALALGVIGNASKSQGIKMM